MTGWYFLLLAIVSEVCGTSSLKASDGMSRWLPALLGYLFYGASLTAMGRALRHIDMSVAYSVWCGLGMVLVTIIGVCGFSEPLRLSKVIAVALIMAGVISLNLSGSSH